MLLPTEGFRTTVRALVVDGKPAFRKHQSHDPVMIDSCLVAHPAIDELLREGKFGRATEVTLRVGAGTGERAALADPADTIMDLPPDVMRGKNATVHEVIDGYSMRVSINSFFQSRTDGAATLARLVREATGPDKVIADLYCGVGLFAVTADRPKRVVAVERGRSAVADAKHNLKGRDARDRALRRRQVEGQQGRRRRRRPEPRRPRHATAPAPCSRATPNASCSSRATRPRSRATSACSSAPTSRSRR